MEIGSSLSIYSGLGALFEQGKSKNKQADEFGGSARNQSGAGLQPSATPPSIANTMWAVQAGNETYINPSDAEMEAKAAHRSLVDEFTDWSNMDPAEFIRARYLESRGLTEDDLKAMPADQREAIEKEIAEQIKRELTGIEDNGTATTDDVPAA
ncbi:hypothetical protein FHX06_004690 [Rhizobium sp. BK512]|uniref:hypothetical protein n=1 Tax=Rhizobium sp. BK512 TaxID=2587010 RepID=UPI00161DF5F4|nr:hypothetical protein [Rhizobium sp. BK512]MBB3563346.1 hypothetical protein [Rhizobium sp. BK512]